MRKGELVGKRVLLGPSPLQTITRLAIVGAALLLLGASAGDRLLPTILPARGFEPNEVERDLKPPEGKAAEFRAKVLASARVWSQPSEPPSRVDLGKTGDFAGRPLPEEAICKFHPKKKLGGHTPKFDCVFEGGEILRVKYNDPEVHAEVAASRLANALGFASDQNHYLRTVRCFGCPEDPAALLACVYAEAEVDRARCSGDVKRLPDGRIAYKANYEKFVDFHNVAVERRRPGKTVETRDDEGWSFRELDEAQGSGKGSTRAERDALRLLAVFLEHWDHGPSNQRLLCVPGEAAGEGEASCTASVAYIHDLGATFGRGGRGLHGKKADLEAWQSSPIWKDAASCRVAIPVPLLHSKGFDEATISEPGRRLLADGLTQLSDDAIRGLFAGAGFAESGKEGSPNRQLDRWVNVFKAKVREIAARPPCPTS